MFQHQKSAVQTDHQRLARFAELFAVMCAALRLYLHLAKHSRAAPRRRKLNDRAHALIFCAVTFFVNCPYAQVFRIRNGPPARACSFIPPGLTMKNRCGCSCQPCFHFRSATLFIRIAYGCLAYLSPKGLWLSSVPMTLAEFIDSHRDQNLAELNDFLRIPSVSAKSEHKPDIERAARWVADNLRSAGFQSSEVIPTSLHPLVYAESLNAPGKPTILFYGHYDVQPAEPLHLWTAPP